MTTVLDTYLPTLNGRCHHGAHLATQGCPDCTPLAPVTDKDAAYRLFRAAVDKAVRPDRTVHACDMRPLTHGRIESRLLSSCWSRARRERVLVEAGTERSDDEAGKNAGRWEPFYSMGAAA